MLVGAHVSVKGGLSNAFTWARDFGCESLQIFTKSQLQWAAKPISKEEVQAWHAAWEEFGSPPCVVHDSYLINLASGNAELRAKSVAGMCDELRRADLLKIPWVVAHPGSCIGSSMEEGVERCAKSLRETLKRTSKCEAGILLETTAGTGNTLGATFEQLAELLEQSGKSNRIGVCVDTCHIFASGYDLCTAKGYAQTWRDFESTIGFENLHAFHLNDSKFPLGSHKDRHAEIGKGEMGIEPFKRLMKDSRFKKLPGVTELADEFTPSSIERLKRLRK